MSEEVTHKQSSTQQEFQAKLQAMQTKFQESLPARLKAIDQAWDSVKEGTDVKEALELLHRLVHTLTGSAGTFSCKQLSNDSRALEIVLKSIIHDNQNHALTQEQREQVSILLDLVINASQTPFGNDLLKDIIAPRTHHPVGKKIIVIEDDVDLSKLLYVQLEHFDYEVEIITELVNVKESIVRFEPDLLIIDINFPEGAYAGIEEIARFDFIKHLGLEIPKIFISARQDIEARLQVVRAGGDAYLCKPLNLSFLLEKVRELSNAAAEEHYQILVIDDDHALVDLMEFVLEKSGMDVHTVTHPQEALEAISRQKPDLILMDIHMPWCNGIELAQVIRQQPTLSGIPIIFLSSETDEDVQFTAVLKGGDDFLTKPIDINRLPIFIRAKAKRARELSSLMIKDGLTGLYNHTYIKELIETEMYRAQRGKKIFSIVMLDVDHFKHVNDTYGHVAGDQVLRNLAHFLIQRLRKSDKVGRYGGEEFMVLLPETGMSEAKDLFDGILNDFGEIHHHDSEGNNFNVTFSAGVISNEITEDIAVLLERVDQTLYKAKSGGRNQVLETERLSD